LASPVVNSSGRQVLLFAGEATHANYFSTVHGAIETGYREAERISKIYKYVRLQCHSVVVPLNFFTA
jgi:spermine oxidase